MAGLAQAFGFDPKGGKGLTPFSGQPAIVAGNLLEFLLGLLGITMLERIGNF